MAGRSSFEASQAKVGEFFSPDRMLWGYSDDLWSTYEVFGQPVSFIVSSDDVIVGQWFGAATETELRAAFDYLVDVG